MMGRSESFKQFYFVKDNEFDNLHKDIILENFYFQYNTDNIEEAKEVKPLKHELKKLKVILKHPNFRKLEVQDVFLMWKFRYYLIDNAEALPKFLKSVKWTNQKFIEESLELMEQWAPAKYDDALYLLSRTFSINPIYKTDLDINSDDVSKVFTAIR
jgi:hypothetical protein